MIDKAINFSSLIILGGLLLSCSLPTDPGPQPTIIVNTGTETRINVFGLFRPDSGMSFILVGGSYSLESAEDFEDQPWPDPDVVVVDSLTGEIFNFATAPDDSSKAYWDLDDFIAEIGHTYQVTVTAPGYETVTGSATVPASPDIADFVMGENDLTVTINTLPNINSYEVHLNLADGNPIIRTVTAYGDAQVSVDFSWSSANQHPVDFVVYGYERNLSEYLNTTISIKPQSYQPQEYYVEGGFGVIGALNFTEPVSLDD